MPLPGNSLSFRERTLSETASTSDSPGPNRRGSIAKKRRGCEERSEARPSCKSIPSAFLRLSSRASSSRLEPSKLSCNTDQLGGGGSKKGSGRDKPGMVPVLPEPLATPAYLLQAVEKRGRTFYFIISSQCLSSIPTCCARPASTRSSLFESLRRGIRLSCPLDTSGIDLWCLLRAARVQEVHKRR